MCVCVRAFMYACMYVMYVLMYECVCVSFRGIEALYVYDSGLYG